MWFVQVLPIVTVVALSEKVGQPYSRLTFSRHPKWLYSEAPIILLGFLICSQPIQENIGILPELHYNRVLKFFKHSWATLPSDANTYGRTVNHRNVMKMLAVCGFVFYFLWLILLKRQPCQLLSWERHYLSGQLLLLNSETLCANENNADDFHTIISYNKILCTCRAVFIVRFSFGGYHQGR